MAFKPAPDLVIGGKYRLVRRVAGGGMGAVWLAKHQALDADVAVKLMSPSLADTPTALARFEREAKASAQLKSPHIVKVQDYGVEDETPFMVMELLTGEDLGERLQRERRLPLKEVAGIAAQVCKALKVAHGAGIVHRDLKPSNVFLAREGDDETVKLLDFGIARETLSNLVDDKTHSGVVLGSPHHMSPEQAHGERVDHRSDIWSLGVVLFRALTGVRPFDGEAATAVMLAIVTKPIPRVAEVAPDLPAELDRFFDRCLNRDVERRFESAAVLSSALTAIAEGRDAAVWLEPADAPRASLPTGRDEATLDGAIAATPPPSERAVNEHTASRELRAVTTGVGTRRGARGSAARFLPWVALPVAIGALGYFIGKSGREGPATSAAPAGERMESTAAASAPPGDMIVTPVATTSATSSAVASASAASSSAAPSAAPAKPPPPQRTAPAARPKIDPFTGLPIP